MARPFTPVSHRRRRRGRPGREERGAVAVLVAISFTVFVVLLALVVDLGLARDTRRVSQNAADASALAAANTLYPASACPTGGTKPCTADAVAAVKSYAQVNFGVAPAQWTSCSATVPSGYVAVGGTSCIAFNNATSPTKVWVKMPTRNVQTAFAGIIGKSQVPVSSQAEAELGTEVKCSLCFLGPVDAGNADFSVTGGAIAVNGNVDAGPNSIWTATSNGVVGTVNGGVFSPAPTPISPFADPMAGLALPLSDPLHVAKTGTPCVGGPGIYSNPITLGNNVDCHLLPGLYVIRNTWLIGNNTVIDCPLCVAGAGVTMFVPSPGYLNFKNGYISVKAPTLGTFKDLAIVYARDNTNPISIQGNGATGITGTVYAPSSALDFNGNSCFGFSQGPIVVNGVVKANGNKACIEIDNAKETTVTRTDLHLSQ
ncbi:pilus assembly protein TadG-related protein [Oryzobacter terrae]|uniref:pilus assembly protein TadG-related protein n=1 Tax=Oryzobacter terrae TaxID=1620385 RepID=UPI00366DC3E8